jgi:hypothetical protein
VTLAHAAPNFVSFDQLTERASAVASSFRAKQVLQCDGNCTRPKFDAAGQSPAGRNDFASPGTRWYMSDGGAR